MGLALGRFQFGFSSSVDSDWVVHQQRMWHHELSFGWLRVTWNTYHFANEKVDSGLGKFVMCWLLSVIVLAALLVMAWPAKADGFRCSRSYDSITCERMRTGPLVITRETPGGTFEELRTAEQIRQCKPVRVCGDDGCVVHPASECDTAKAMGR